MRFHADRPTNGQLDKREKEPRDKTRIGDQVSELGKKWADSVEDRLTKQLEEDLHSVRLANEFQERWPQEYQSLEMQVKDMTKRGKAIAKTIENASHDPLSNLHLIEPTLVTADKLRRELAQLKSTLGLLKRQMQQDRIAVLAAKDHDTQYIREKLKISDLDGNRLSQYLLGEEITNRVGTAISWIRWSRDMLGASDSNQSDKQRGVNIPFPWMQNTPDFLIEQLALEGYGTVAGKPFQFSGFARDITHQSPRHEQPITLEVAGTGAIEFTCHAVLDRRGEPMDRVVVDVPALQVPVKVLGDGRKLSFRVSGGVAQVHADVELHNEALSGLISFIRNDVQVRPNLTNAYTKKAIVSNLDSSFDSLQSITAELKLAGTLQEPKWQLASNLGPELAKIMNAAVKQEVAQRERQLQQKIGQLVDGEIASLQSQLSKKQTQLVKELQISETELASIKTLVAAKIRGSEAFIDGGKKILELIKR